MKVFTMAHVRRAARRDWSALSGKERVELSQKANSGLLTTDVFRLDRIPSNPERQGVLLKGYVRAVALLAKNG
jgi:hypothetical protein